MKLDRRRRRGDLHISDTGCLVITAVFPAIVMIAVIFGAHR